MVIQKREFKVLIVLFLVLILQFSFILSQVQLDSSGVGTEEAGQDKFGIKDNKKNVIVEEIDGKTKITVKKDGSFETSDGQVFNNIEEGGQLTFDGNGNVIEGKFETTSKQQENIKIRAKGQEFEVPPNSKVDIKEDNDVAGVVLAKGSKINGPPKILDDSKEGIVTYKSKEGDSEIKLDEKQVPFSGDLSFENDNGKAVPFVNTEDNFKAYGVNVNTKGKAFSNGQERIKDKTYLYFKRKGFTAPRVGKDYLLMDKDIGYLQGGGSEAILEKGNPFVPMDDKTTFNIAANKESSFRVYQEEGKKPVFETSGDITTDIGKNGFYVKGNKLLRNNKGTFLSNPKNSKDSNSPPIEWRFTNKDNKALVHVKGFRNGKEFSEPAKLIFNTNNQAVMVRESADFGYNMNPLKVFSGEACGPCKQLKEYLTNQGIPYESVEVLDKGFNIKPEEFNKLPENIQEVINENGVPFTTDSKWGNPVSGYSQKEIQGLLENTGGVPISSRLQINPVLSVGPSVQVPGQQVPVNNINPLQSSVRLRVGDSSRVSFGTGVYIGDSQDGKSSIFATAGHPFRGYTPTDTIKVDIFDRNQKKYKSVDGKLISKDLTADVGLFSIPKQNIRGFNPVRLAPNGYVPKVGDEVFSIGCGGGNIPTRIDCKVTSINRYDGPQNIETTIIAIQGRSGGPLFTKEKGEFIGIIIAADPEEKKALHAGTKPLYNLMRKNGFLYLIPKNLLILIKLNIKILKV